MWQAQAGLLEALELAWLSESTVLAFEQLAQAQVLEQQWVRVWKAIRSGRVYLVSAYWWAVY
jgi:hypothetical protein